MTGEMGERRAEWLMNLALTAGGAALWVSFGFLNDSLTFAHYAPGVDLIYLPAGVRLAIILMFGVWGALGIVLSNPVLFLKEFNAGAAEDILINSVIAGFVPLLAVMGCRWLLGIDRSLMKLKAQDLPALALAVSVATPIAFNLHFLVHGLKPFKELWPSLTGMMLGDFLGCLIVLGTVKAVLWATRRLKFG